MCECQNIQQQLDGFRSIEIKASDVKKYREIHGTGLMESSNKLKVNRSNEIIRLEKALRDCKIKQLKGRVSTAATVDELRFLMLEMIKFL